MIVDSHCHLDYSELYDQLDRVVKRAEINQVKYMLTICTTLESFEKIKLIVKKYKNVYGTFGIHPHETEKFTNVDSKFICLLKNKYKKIIGIGETGLDYFYNHSDKTIQKKSFIEHIKAASELDIPVIVHSRNAEEDTYEILKSEKKNSNLKVLIPFKKSLNLVKAVATIPLENLLVETDSPYLSPIPYRGKSNEPSYIIHTVDKLSEIKKINKKYLMVKTTDNFFKLFNLN